MEKELKPEESLKIIQNMIQASQQKFADNGIFMIIWAVVLILGAIANYFLILSNLDTESISRWTNIIWISFTSLGGLISIFVGIRHEKKETVHTHIGRILKLMWFGFGIALFFTILFPVLNDRSPIPYILILTSFAVYIFALVIRYTPFMIGSLCILIFGAVSFWVQYDAQLLAFALAIISGYLMPGIMLNRKYNTSK